MSPNHLLFPSTMFSSVLRTFSKSCLLDSLRSSIAGKIRERKITTCNKKSGWEGLTERVGQVGQKEKGTSMFNLFTGGGRSEGEKCKVGKHLGAPGRLQLSLCTSSSPILKLLQKHLKRIIFSEFSFLWRSYLTSRSSGTSMASLTMLRLRST